MEPLLGQFQLFAFGYAPGDGCWLLCNGQLLQIRQYTALFSLIGVKFGGDGQTTFGLPNLSNAGYNTTPYAQWYIAVNGIYPQQS